MRESRHADSKKKTGSDAGPAPWSSVARWGWRLLPIVLIVGTVFAWPFRRSAQPPKPGRVPVWSYRIVNVYPHDPKAFTQGLVLDGGFLYEGTGQYKESTLRKVDVKTGNVLQFVRLNPQLFGEGITIYNDKIYQLTWKARRGLIFDRKTLKYESGFRYSGEGWGITHDGTHLILSDGSSTLRFLDPKTFRVVKKLSVKSQGRPLDRLNELEYIGGEIYANVYHTDHLVRISPATGEVLGWIDLTGLVEPRERTHEQAVLNGIAFDPATGHLFVTGKYWPKMFEIELLQGKR